MNRALLAVLVGASTVSMTASSQPDHPAWPLRASSNGRYLEDQLGEPFLVVGDTPWSMAVALTEVEMEAYLDDRIAHGFNTILVNAIEHGFNGDIICGGLSEGCHQNHNGDAPFNAMDPVDFADPNEDYWVVVDTMLDKAKSRGMLVLMTPAYLGFVCGAEGWANEILNQATDGEMKDYGEFLGQRYAGQGNLIWVHGGDSHPDRCTGLSPVDRAALVGRIEAIDAGIEVYDATTLRTAHDERGYSAADAFEADSWTLGLGTTYSACEAGDAGGEPFPNAFATPLQTKEDWDDTPTKPFIFIEGRYENEVFGSVSEEPCVISQAWWSILGGSTGQMFGNNPVWKLATDWEGASGIGDARSDDIRHFSEFWRDQPWWQLTPDYSDTYVTAGRGAKTDSAWVAAAGSATGNRLIVFVPENVQITVDMSQLAGDLVDVSVYDAKDGISTFEGTYPTTGTRNFQPGPLKVLVFSGMDPVAEVPSLDQPAQILLAVALATLGVRLLARNGSPRFWPSTRSYIPTVIPSSFARLGERELSRRTERQSMLQPARTLRAHLGHREAE